MSSYGLWLTSMNYLLKALIALVILFDFGPNLTLGSHQPYLFMKIMCKTLLHIVVWLPFYHFEVRLHWIDARFCTIIDNGDCI